MLAISNREEAARVQVSQYARLSILCRPPFMLSPTAAAVKVMFMPKEIQAHFGRLFASAR